MKKIYLLLSIVLFLGTNLSAQSLDSLFKSRDLQYRINPKFMIEIDSISKDPSRYFLGRTSSMYDRLGLVDAVFFDKIDSLSVGIYLIPPKYPILEDEIKQVFTKESFYEHVFSRLCSTFSWSKPYSSPTDKDLKEVESLVHYLSKAKAKELFNADKMFIYPIRTKNEKYYGKELCVRGVVIARNYQEVFLYFAFPYDNINRFDEYLKEFGKVLYFKKHQN